MGHYSISNTWIGRGSLRSNPGQYFGYRLIRFGRRFLELRWSVTRMAIIELIWLYMKSFVWSLILQYLELWDIHARENPRLGFYLGEKGIFISVSNGDVFLSDFDLVCFDHIEPSKVDNVGFMDAEELISREFFERIF